MNIKIKKSEFSLAVIVISILLYYTYNIITVIVGTSYVDSTYLALSKALAQGYGYYEIWKAHRLLHSYFPPFYPLVLSIIWRIYPEFPQNIFYFKFLNVILAGSCLFLTYKLARRWMNSYLYAAAVVILTATNYSFIVNSVSIESEMLYMTIQLSIFYLADKYFSYAKKTPAQLIICLTFLAILLSLTRAVGLAMVLALTVYLLKYKKIKLPLISVLLILPIIWFFYAFISGHKNHISLYLLYTPSITAFFEMLINNIANLFSRNLPFLVVNTVYSATILSWLGSLSLQWLAAIAGLAVSVLIFYGASRVLATKSPVFYNYFIFYLLFILLWMHIPVSFMLVLLPFTILFFFVGIGKLFDKLGITSRRVIILIFFILLTANVKRDMHNDVMADEKAMDEYFSQTHLSLYNWIKENTTEDDIIATTYDPMLYLYTGRKTVGYVIRDYRYKGMDIFEFFKKAGVSYIAQLPYYNEMGRLCGIKQIAALKKTYPESIQLVYKSRYPSFCIYKFDAGKNN